jgi:hypothetical protein
MLLELMDSMGRLSAMFSIISEKNVLKCDSLGGRMHGVIGVNLLWR